MSVPGMMSPLEEARKKISKDEIKEGLKLLEESLGTLGMEESAKRGFRTNITVFLARYARIQKEKPNQMPEYYHMQLNALATDTVELINLIEEEVGRRVKATSSKISIKDQVELVVDIEFSETREEEIENLLTRLATIININPREFLIVNKKTNRVIVEAELSMDHISNIKSLLKIGVWKGEINIKGFGGENIKMPENQHIYLASCQLSGANLTGVDLSKANLNKANLSKANLSKANLIGANLNGANLSKANLNEVDLNGANLIGVDLKEANLEKANLRGADLRETDLSEADLSGARLMWTNLNNANLIRANLIRANLSGANLSGATLSNAILSNTKLNGANLFEANLFEADLTEADLTEANLTMADLIVANLISANLSGADLGGADLSGADFNGSSLMNADLRGTYLHSANLLGADLSSASFHFDQAEILKKMKVNISKVIFVDEEGKQVRLEE